MVSKDQIDELRRLFYERLNSEGLSTDYFHRDDLKKINSTDDWLRRFLIHHEGNTQESLDMLWETLNWRKINNVNEINENTINLDFIKDGSMFLHGQDIDGKTLLIFRCKMHFKGQKDWEENSRCIIYWFERAEKMNKGDQITIFFDMSESGLSNMDMNYTKYLIGLCKQYYPNFLNYIIIFEMPWVMNAAFKVIKSWLPPKAIEKIKFLSKSSLKDYVPPKYVLKYWGGENEYEFSFVPQVNTDDETTNVEETKKRVSFFEGSPGVKSETTLSLNSSIEEDDDCQTIVSSGTKLRISPPTTVTFKKDSYGDINATITIVNLNSNNVAFKIKTTSPETFRVRPGSGILEPEEKADICVSLLGGVYTPDIVKYKFLVMSTVLKDNHDKQSTDLVVLWKNINSIDVDHHKLKCAIHSDVAESIITLDGGKRLATSSSNGGSLFNTNSLQINDIHFQTKDPNVKLDAVCQAISRLDEKIQKKSREFQVLLIFTLSLVILLTSFVIYIYLNLPLSSQNQSKSPITSTCDMYSSSSPPEVSSFTDQIDV